MRLTCPNCGAQYEVDAGLIPDTGRDVQCSNCGHGWFQQPEGAEGEAPLRLDSGSDEEAAPRRKLDPKVAGVLREEAEHEAAVRRAETEGAFGGQADLGLEDADERAAAQRSGAAARARMARLRGTEEEEEAAPAPTPETPRRDLLPDVEEINSTLRGQDDREEVVVVDDPMEDEAPARGGGFRAGFYLVLFLALIALGVYAFAPQIAGALPQVEPLLVSYVEAVNGLRDTVNGWIASAVGAVQGMIGGNEG